MLQWLLQQWRPEKKSKTLHLLVCLIYFLPKGPCFTSLCSPEAQLCPEHLPHLWVYYFSAWYSPCVISSTFIRYFKLASVKHSWTSFRALFCGGLPALTTETCYVAWQKFPLSVKPQTSWSMQYEDYPSTLCFLLALWEILMPRKLWESLHCTKTLLCDSTWPAMSDWNLMFAFISLCTTAVRPLFCSLLDTHNLSRRHFGNGCWNVSNKTSWTQLADVWRRQVMFSEH